MGVCDWISLLYLIVYLLMGDWVLLRFAPFLVDLPSSFHIINIIYYILILDLNERKQEHDTT